MKQIESDKWHVRATYRSGKKFNKTVRGSKADAQRVLNDVLRDIDDGKQTRPSKLTLGQWVDLWLAEHCTHQSVRTRADSRAILNRYLTPAMRNHRLVDLTPTMVQRWLNNLEALGKRTYRTKAVLAPRTKQLARATLRNCLARAVKLEMLQRNVAREVDVPRKVKLDRVAFSPTDAKRFLAACTHHPSGVCFALMLHTGLRPGEVLALRWQDLHGSDLHVRHALIRVKGHPAFLSTTKTGRARTIPIGPSILAALHRHRKAQLERRFLLGELYEDRDLIFPGELGGYGHAHNLLTRGLKPLLEAAGLPHMRLYDLRHSCATLLLASGEQLKVVQERLGHSSATLTLDTYAHVLPGAQQQTSLRMEALLAQHA